MVSVELEFEIEASLIKHPKELLLCGNRKRSANRRLVAYIVPTPTENEDSQGQQVELWQKVFNDTYLNNPNSLLDPTLNLAGWNDRYTGKAYP
ncbi:hypothetical protein AB0758_48120 [Tolypothrix bouteillei VB521301_2]|uniref:hypothetical protein n=1 Tax=Tolypothrix bouteillei TaxID=1246981 RepID=UPI0038B46AD5